LRRTATKSEGRVRTAGASFGANASCCGLGAVDQSNLASIVECLPAECELRAGFHFACGRNVQSVTANSGAQVSLLETVTVAGLPQRLDVIVGNISAHGSPTSVAWTQTQGAPLP